MTEIKLRTVSLHVILGEAKNLLRDERDSSVVMAPRRHSLRMTSRLR